MTTKFTPPDWAGQSVAILANGPGMSDEVADGARSSGRRIIVCNRAVRFAPWADLFVALDPEHHAGLEFSGRRIVGADCDVDAEYAGMLYESVRISEGHTVEVRNNLLAAMRIAAAAGVNEIVLYCVDEAAYETAHPHFPWLAAGLASVTAELEARGIAVRRFEPVTPVVVEDAVGTKRGRRNAE